LKVSVCRSHRLVNRTVETAGEQAMTRLPAMVRPLLLHIGGRLTP